MKVLTIVGTRPEVIRLSRVIARLEQTVDHVLVHTGQNYDHLLNEIFFADLGLRPPDHVLRVDTSSLGRVLGNILIRIEEVLHSERPNAVLILGDTNTSIAAIMAKRLRIPIYHMEAGNRCFDENVPEETNRRFIDHIADFNLVYTEHARRNLLAEGLHPRRILLTGSPMREVLTTYRKQIDASDVLDRLNLSEGGYFLVSAHREENVDSPPRLGLVLDCLEAVSGAFGLPVLVSTHPRTRKRLFGMDRPMPNGVVLHEPFGFHDYNRLQLSASCVLSDSGTVAEESTILGFPAITLRESIERPEALDTGGILMTGLDVEDVVSGVRLCLDRASGPADPSRLIPDDYRIVNTAERAVTFMLSTAKRHQTWAGIRN